MVAASTCIIIHTCEIGLSLFEEVYVSLALVGTILTWPFRNFGL